MNRHQAYTVSEFDTEQRGIFKALEDAFTKVHGREMNEEELTSIVYFVSRGRDSSGAADAFILSMKSAYERGYRARADEDYAQVKALLAEQQAE